MGRRLGSRSDSSGCATHGESENEQRTLGKQVGRQTDKQTGLFQVNQGERRRDSQAGRQAPKQAPRHSFVGQSTPRLVVL